MNDADAAPPVPSPRSRARRLAVCAPLLLPLAALVGTGLWGIDFGVHWDEPVLRAAALRAIQGGKLLPGFYKYPSVAPDLVMLATLPEVLESAGRAITQGSRLRWTLVPEFDGGSYHLRVRAVFLCVSALAVVWVYFAALIWQGRRALALLAGAALACSWEVGYHARWIAPDAVLMQFGALTLLCVLAARQRANARRWLGLAAVAAGLGCGTKYPGGLLLLPVLIAVWQTRPAGQARSTTLARLGQATLLFAAAFMVCTPGALFEMKTFIHDVRFELAHYAGGHLSWTIAPGLEHLGRNLEYLGLVLLSPISVIAAGLSALAIVGVFATARESRGAALLLLSFPVVYVLYMSTQSTMIVRNLLVVAPFAAIFVARGAAAIGAGRPRRALRYGLAGLLALFMAVNAGWLAYAADTICRRTPQRRANALAEYMEAHPQRRFWISDGVRRMLTNAAIELPANISAALDQQVDFAALLASEKPGPLGWPANRRDLTVTWFGPREVNMNYYPDWWGAEHILLLRGTVARRCASDAGAVTPPPS